MNLLSVLNFDRSDFGSAAVPLWYPQNEFERFATGMLERARENDPQALFALGLYASGDVRTMNQYRAMENRVTTFLKRITPLVAAEATVEGKGKVIFVEMCREFYGMKSNQELVGYSFAESRLSATFRTGAFNCVSSSMLYVILARYFSIESLGVKIPSHVFVVIDKPDGIGIEVETTHGIGYGMVHDKDFFDDRKKSWFANRGLERATYDDYLNRSILTPMQLIVGNMNNQHTDQRRMSIQDQYRLYEARGYFMPRDRSSAISRLQVYLSEFNYLSMTNQPDVLVRFAKTVSAGVDTLVAIHQTDPEMTQLFAAVKPMADYLVLLKSGEVSDHSPCVRMRALAESIVDTSVYTLQTVLSVLRPCLIDMSKNGEIDSALTIMDIMRVKGQHDTLLAPNYFNLPNFAVPYYWNRGDYDKVIALCRLALKWAPDEQSRVAAGANIERAYRNKAAVQSNAGNRDKARKILDDCISSAPSSAECREMLRKLKRWKFSP